MLRLLWAGCCVPCKESGLKDADRGVFLARGRGLPKGKQGLTGHTQGLLPWQTSVPVCADPHGPLGMEEEQ